MSDSANKYPFVTRRQILERIAAEPAFAAQCVAIIQGRHDTRVSAAGSSGWMASHATKATKLAARLAAGEATSAEAAEATALASRYSKQLAAHFRSAEMAEHPELSAVAAVFSVGAPAAVAVAAARSAGTSITPEVLAAVPIEAPRRRGRPKGSKNKAKAPPENRLRRRSR